ncbi:MAG TPA: stage II sporulation protein M [Candidatus Sulfopaludibacter sp.]|nr:stage II sporulation protein M [Candidatus Sulfopaludibacter sp.]
MILDLARFVAAERPYWDELRAMLDRTESGPESRMPLAAIQRLHYLYERCSADLAQIDTFATEPALRTSLEALVSRAYNEIHETRAPMKMQWKRLLLEFPRAFRRHPGAWRLSAAVTILGCAFGWFAIRQDPRSKAVLMPFPGLLGSPSERVHKEEAATADRLKGLKASFSAQLMSNNIHVTILALALGITWGAGTLVLLFYNGAILGAVAADYIGAGQGVFLAGWLLPHGSVEIPAALLGGQAGFMLAGALIGWGDRTPRAARLRAISHDLFAIVAGAAAMLVWAGLVEAFVSQYHQPVVPYTLKIAFGLCELAALTMFLWWAGRA